jgi:hypothetical protein
MCFATRKPPGIGNEQDSIDEDLAGGGRTMRYPGSKHDPEIADAPPVSNDLTDYDRSMFVVYLRLLDAAAEGADWREVARIVLRVDPDRERIRARRMYETHLARAQWMTEHGYRHLLQEPPD